MICTRKPITGNGKPREAGFAILMVVLVLVALAIIGAPFAISMRQEEQTSISFSARVRAKLAAEAALQFALSRLEQTHEFNETYNAEHSVQTPHNSPSVDSNGEFRVDLQDAALNGLETAKPGGVMWGVQVTDEQGKINLKTASRTLLFNLARQLFGDARAQAIADAIVQYRDVGRQPFTALTQLREITVSPRLTAAEFDRLTAFLTVHSASLVGDVPSHSLALHPVNINTCSEEVLRALLLGLRLAPQPGDTQVPVAVSPAEVESLILRLRVFPALAAATAKNAASVPLNDASALPVSGWIAIEGDAVKFTAKAGNSVTVVSDPTDAGYAAGRVDDDHPHVDTSNPKYIQTPLDQVEVRLLFADVENDLANVLTDMVTKGELAADSRSAILANAINPLNTAALDITTTTAPLSFRSFNIYTIEAHGISSAADGRELARYTVREVAQINPCGQLQIKVDTQEDFERSRQGGIASHVATWPNATQVSDIPPSNTDSWVLPIDYARHGRLGLQAAEYSPAGTTTFVARFHGPLKRNVLRGETPGTNMPDYDKAVTTVKVDPGSDSDLEPEGIHVGEVYDKTTGKPTDRRVLAYPARNDTDTSLSNFPQGADYIQPFVVEMWVKFDSAAQFDYSRDHFLLDLAEETFTNRVALYYDSTGPTEGDIVLQVSGPTLQPTPSQVRYHITQDTFEPQRWYHVAIAVKGSDYGQMALLIDGQNVGRFEPSALLVSDGGASLGCDRLAPYDGADYFAGYTWPQEDCVIVEGELIEHVAAAGSALTVRAAPYSGRGARGTLQVVHGAGAHVAIYGYDDRVVPACDDTSLLPTMDHLPRAGEVPTLVGTDKIPATMALAKVDDGFDGTASSSTAYWKPNSDPTAGYAAVTGLTNNEIPADGWLPIAHSDPWVIEKGGTVADDTTAFDKVAQDTTFLGFLSYAGGKTVTTGDHAIEDTQNGFGFFRVESNPGVTDGVGEEIKYA